MTTTNWTPAATLAPRHQIFIDGEWRDAVAPVGGSALATITREPLGVIGAVIPWNYPLEMAVWKLAPALAAASPHRT